MSKRIAACEHDRMSATAKGREAFVKRIETAAEECGATIERHEFNGDREIGLDVVFGPFRCMLHVEGGSHVGAFLGHWYVSTASDLKYPGCFASDIRGTMNTFHCAKATTCENTLEDFIVSLRGGLDSLAIEHPDLIAEVSA